MHNQPTTSELLRDYRARWQLVAQREADELRVLTVEQRWRKLNGVIAMAVKLDVALPARDVGAVRARWTRLKGDTPYVQQHDDLALRRFRSHTGARMMSGELSHLQGPLEAVQRLIERLGDQGVIIGGVAAALLGKPRLTADVDALVLLDIAEVPRLLAAAQQEGLIARFADTESFARQSRVVLLQHAASGVDVDISLGALPFEAEIVARSRMQQVGSTTLRLPTPEDLIVMKSIAHRPQDLLDIQAVIHSHPQLDRPRIQFWLEQCAELLELPEIWTDIAKWL